VPGLSSLSDLTTPAFSPKADTSLRTSMKLSGPYTMSKNVSFQVSFALVSKAVRIGSAKYEDIKPTSLSKFGTFSRATKSGTYSLTWENSYPLTTNLNANGFGMVLGELVAFCGKLYAADQATGIVYEVSTSGNAFPRYIIMG
jgi:hypothetical protein